MNNSGWLTLKIVNEVRWTCKIISIFSEQQIFFNTLYTHSLFYRTEGREDFAHKRGGNADVSQMGKP